MKTLVLCAALGLGIAACESSTTIEQAWRAPQQPATGLRNVVTVYLAPDGAMRRSVEDAMAQRLARIGVHAVPAYTVLADNDLRDRERIRTTLAGRGYDGIVALRLVSRGTEFENVPGTFDGYWGMAWPGVYGDWYVRAETVVRVETSVYDLTNSKLLWSGLSKTLDPATTSEAIDDVTKVVAKALDKQQIVASAGSLPPPG
jgi:hypothetical protein